MSSGKEKNENHYFILKLSLQKTIYFLLKNLLSKKINYNIIKNKNIIGDCMGQIGEIDVCVAPFVYLFEMKIRICLNNNNFT